MAASILCRRVANKVVTPMRATNAPLGRRRPIHSLETRTALWLRRTRPTVWITTVTTVNGNPHAHSVRNASGSATCEWGGNSKYFFLCATRSGCMFESPRQPFSEIFTAYQ